MSDLKILEAAQEKVTEIEAQIKEVKALAAETLSVLNKQSQKYRKIVKDFTPEPTPPEAPPEAPMQELSEAAPPKQPKHKPAPEAQA